jgi:hypothetical protein
MSKNPSGRTLWGPPYRACMFLSSEGKYGSAPANCIMARSLLPGISWSGDVPGVDTEGVVLVLREVRWSSLARSSFLPDAVSLLTELLLRTESRLACLIFRSRRSPTLSASSGSLHTTFHMVTFWSRRKVAVQLEGSVSVPDNKDTGLGSEKEQGQRGGQSL